MIFHSFRLAVLTALLAINAAPVIRAQTPLPQPALSFDFDAQAKPDGVKGAARVLDAANWFDADWKSASSRGAVAFWFKPDWNGSETVQRSFVEGGSAGAPNSMALRKLTDARGNPYLQFVLWDENGAPFTCDAPRIAQWKSGEWHHVAISWSAGGMTDDSLLLAVDGEAWAGVKRRAISWKAPTQWRIGSAAANVQWNAGGAMDELQFFSKELDAAQINQLFAAVKAPASTRIAPETPAPKPVEATIKKQSGSLVPVLPRAVATRGEATKIALTMNDFRETYSGAPEAASHRSSAGATWDDTNLYLRVRCEKPRGEALQAAATARDGAVWNDDSIEVFLASSDASAPLKHFIVNTKNVVFDSTIDRTQSMESAAWNGAWKSSVALGDDFYEVALIIPWSDILSAKPFSAPTNAASTRSAWRLNIARNRPGAPTTAWAATLGILNRPNWLGFLQLQSNGADAESALHVAQVQRDGGDALVTFTPTGLSGAVTLEARVDGKIVATRKIDDAKSGENIALRVALSQGDTTFQFAAKSRDQTVAADRQVFARVERLFAARAAQWAYWSDEKITSLILEGKALDTTARFRLNVRAMQLGKTAPISLLKNAELPASSGTQRLEISVDLAPLAPGKYTLQASIAPTQNAAAPPLHAQNEILILPAPPAFTPRAAVKSARVLAGKTGVPIRLNGAPMLPISMHWLSPQRPDAKLAARMGIDIAAAFIESENGDLESLQSQLDEMQRVGLLAHLHFDGAYFMEKQPNGQLKPRLDRIEAAVKRYKSHPALFGWYLFDEPNNLTPSGDFMCEPADLEKVNRLIKSIDKNHFTVVTCSNGSDFAAYKNTCDVMSTDVYPIPDVPLTAISQSIEKARRETEKPVWSVVQSAWVRPGQRAVSPQEMLSQAHLSLIHGAAALGFYNWDGHNVPVENDLRAQGYFVYQRSAYKVLALQRSVLLGTLEKNQAAAFMLSNRKFTALAQTETLHARAWQDGDAILFLVVNVTDKTAAVRATFASGNAAQVIGEERALPLTKGALSDTLLPLESRLYRIASTRGAR